MRVLLDTNVYSQVARGAPALAQAVRGAQGQLRRRGTPLPTNDVWIAAHAMETGAELWSLDEHFQQIEGLAWRHLAT